LVQLATRWIFSCRWRDPLGNKKITPLSGVSRMQTKLGIELKFPWLIIIFLIKFAKIEITPQFSARFPWFHHWTSPQLGVDPSWPNLAAGCAAGRSGLAGSAADWGRSWQWRWAGQLNHVFFFFMCLGRLIIDWWRTIIDYYWLFLGVGMSFDVFFFFFLLMGLGIVWLWFLFMFGELRIIDYGWVKDDHRYTNCCLFLVICDGLKKTCWFFFAIL
jgi:hypothetical protein